MIPCTFTCYISNTFIPFLGFKVMCKKVCIYLA